MTFLSSYCGSVNEYAAMLAAGLVEIHSTEPAAGLRRSLNRCAICGANGVATLTVPVIKDTRCACARDVRISEHGDWRRLHWGAMFSAYGKTPFFDYIAADLEPIIRGNQTFILDLNEQLLRLFTEFLDLPLGISLTESPATPPARPSQFPEIPPYYQLWAPRHGFQPHLSILDLLCNLGREAIFTLLSVKC